MNYNLLIDTLKSMRQPRLGCPSLETYPGHDRTNGINIIQLLDKTATAQLLI